MSGGGAVNMKNFETSIPSIAVYNLIFLSMMVFFTWRISSRFYPYGKKILFMHLLINLIPTFYSLSIGLDSYLDTLIAYVLFLGPTLVLYRHSPLWAMTSYIAMFASQTLSEFLVYLVCALIWNMSTVDVSAAHPMLIYIAYFICGMGSLYGVYRFMLQFTTLEKHLRRLFVVAAFSCFTLLFLIPALVISKSPDFTARIVLVFAVSTIVCACTATSPPCAPASAWSCLSGNTRCCWSSIITLTHARRKRSVSCIMRSATAY